MQHATCVLPAERMFLVCARCEDGISNCLNSSVFLLAHAMGRGPKWSQDQLEDAARYSLWLTYGSKSPTSVSEVFRKKRGISHVCDANCVPFLSAGSLMCVTRTVLLTPSASVSI